MSVLTNLDSRNTKGRIQDTDITLQKFKNGNQSGTE
jgi:hypothetical protein